MAHFSLKLVSQSLSISVGRGSFTVRRGRLAHCARDSHRAKGPGLDAYIIAATAEQKIPTVRPGLPDEPQNHSATNGTTLRLPDEAIFGPGGCCRRHVYVEKREEYMAVEERLHIFSLLLVSQQPVNHQVIMRE